MIMVMTRGGIYTTTLFIYTLYLKGNSIADAAQLRFPLLFPRSQVQSSQPTIFDLKVDVVLSLAVAARLRFTLQ
jgi:hypothetical protein